MLVKNHVILCASTRPGRAPGSIILDAHCHCSSRSRQTETTETHGTEIPIPTLAVSGTERVLLFHSNGKRLAKAERTQARKQQTANKRRGCTKRQSTRLSASGSSSPGGPSGLTSFTQPDAHHDIAGATTKHSVRGSDCS